MAFSPSSPTFWNHHRFVWVVVCFVVCGLNSLAGCGGSKPMSAEDYAKDLQSEDPEVRLAAAKGLATFGPGAADALPNMLATLKTDSDPKVRMAVAEAIALLGASAADILPDLETLQYTEKNRDVASHIIRAIQMIKEDSR